MQKVKPSVYLIAETSINHDQILSWLGDNYWEPCLEHVQGSHIEKLTELSARRCYKSYKSGGENSNPNITQIRKDSDKYFENILSSGHGSVMEHGVSTWAFENVSRVFCHEVVRHRAGTAISQESLRFCRINDIHYWLPPEIESNPEATNIFEETIQFLEDKQNQLAKLFDIDNCKNFAEKKKLTSAFRRIAPEGIATGIVISFNMRALRWVIENRTTEHAETEIRLVFNMVAEIAKERWPMIFQDFSKIDTGDGLFKWVPENRKV